MLFFSCTIQLPDTDLCIANAPAKQFGCYNLKKDYEYGPSSITLKPGSVKHYRPLSTIDDVSKWTCTDIDGFANLDAFFHTLQQRCTCQ